MEGETDICMYAASYSLRLNVTLGLTYDAMRFMICMYDTDTIGGKVKSGEKRGREGGARKGGWVRGLLKYI